jgi:hypothetical protein
MTRTQLIRKLLRTNHLNVSERRALVPPAIQYSELLAVVRDTLGRESRFDSLIGVLQRSDDGKYRMHRKGLPFRIEEEYCNEKALVVSSAPAEVVGSDDYDSLDAALQAFIGEILAGASIDGIEIREIPQAKKRPWWKFWA